MQPDKDLLLSNYNYEIPQELIDNAVSKLPAWMLEINSEFDRLVISSITK